jgi:hypothetical protein
MTPKEEQLLQLYKEFADLNKRGHAFVLAGSLSFALLGIEKPREACDIDVLCDDLCEDDLSDGLIAIPKGFSWDMTDGSRSQIDSMRFINKETGVKLELLGGAESCFDNINGVYCAPFEDTLRAKLKYAVNDHDWSSAKKTF